MIEDIYIQFLRKYYEKNGTINDISYYVEYEFNGMKINIYGFLSRMRAQHKHYINGTAKSSEKNDFALSRYKALEEMNFDWEPPKRKSEQKDTSIEDDDIYIRYLWTHYSKYGTINDIKNEDIVEFEGRIIKIGNFVRNIRHYYHEYTSRHTENKTHSKEFINRYMILNTMGFDWENEKRERTTRQIAIKNDVDYKLMRTLAIKYEGNLEKALEIALIIKQIKTLRAARKNNNYSIDNILQAFDINYEEFLSCINRNNLRTAPAKEENTYCQGMTLRDYCHKNGYNYTVINRAVKLKLKGLCDEDLNSLINRMIIEYNVKRKNKVSPWIYSKYGNEQLLRQELLALSLNSDRVLEDMSRNLISLEEAVSHACFRRKSNGQYDSLFDVYKDYIAFIDSDLSIQDFKEAFMVEYHLSDKQFEQILEAATYYKETIHQYRLFEVGFEKDDDRRVKKIIEYGFSAEEIEEAIFAPLQFAEETLLGQDSELYKHRRALKELTNKWNTLSGTEQIVMINGYHLSLDDLRYVTDTRQKIDDTKAKVYQKN